MSKVPLSTELESALLTYLHRANASAQPQHIEAALAYRWQPQYASSQQHTSYTLIPLHASRDIHLDDLHGIDTQKAQLIQNTRQFLAGFPANHVLLTGTRGAGKSSLIRALLTEYAAEGLRIIEVDKAYLSSLDQLKTLLLSTGSKDYKYIIYCDDLAFNREDEHYRALKSSLEGSVSSSGDQFLIYATSNRRHLLPQYMRDNLAIYHHPEETHPHEQIDETVSLSDRFGLWLSFHPMPQAIYLQIVQHHMSKAGIEWSDVLRQDALTWAATRSSRSGRVAYQFARHRIGSLLLDKQCQPNTQSP